MAVEAHSTSDKLFKLATEFAGKLRSGPAMDLEIGKLNVIDETDLPSLQRFSAYSCLGAVDRQSFMELALQDVSVNRSVGSLVGMAVADAIGHPLEFVPVGAPGFSFDSKTFTYTKELNKFRLQRGQWTDDCSMGLCLADSLLLKNGYDGSDVRTRFWNWWFRSYNNAFRNDLKREGSVGLGGNISASLYSISGKPPPRYNVEGLDAGNGSLMRLAAVPVFFHANPAEAASFSAESSYTTHPGDIAAELCGFLGFFIAKAILLGSKSATAKEFLIACIEEYLKLKDMDSEPEGELSGRRVLWCVLRGEGNADKEQCWNWREAGGPFILESLRARGKSYNGHPVSAGYFGAYSADGLAVALRSFFHTSNFIDAVTMCVNFLGDADSTGSIVGQMAGAFYGFKAIDAQAVTQLEQWDDGEIAFRGALLHVLGKPSSQPEQRGQKRQTSDRSPDAKSRKPQ